MEMGDDGDDKMKKHNTRGRRGREVDGSCALRKRREKGNVGRPRRLILCNYGSKWTWTPAAPVIDAPCTPSSHNLGGEQRDWILGAVSF
jgi:hypothetical protein